MSARAPKLLYPYGVKVMGALTLVCAAAAAVAAQGGTGPGKSALSFGLMVCAVVASGVFAILWITLYLVARSARNEVAALRARGFTAEWKVGPERWRETSRRRSLKAQRRTRILAAVVTLMVSISILGLALAQSNAALYPWALTALVAGGLTALLGTKLHPDIQDFRELNSATPAPVWIEVGARGAFLAGRWLAWSGFGRDLVSVELRKMEQTLIVNGEAQSEHGPIPYEVELPFEEADFELVAETARGIAADGGVQFHLRA